MIQHLQSVSRKLIVLRYSRCNVAKKPFKDICLAAREGKILNPEDLSSQDLNTPLIETVVPDIEFRAVVEKNIEEAIRIGTDIANILNSVKPMARVIITKTLFETSMDKDKKMVQLIKKSGLWESI